MSYYLIHIDWKLHLYITPIINDIILGQNMALSGPVLD
jgi:hypothetical protein